MNLFLRRGRVICELAGSRLSVSGRDIDGVATDVSQPDAMLPSDTNRTVGGRVVWVR